MSERPPQHDGPPAGGAPPEGDPGEIPVPDDPFLAEDPAAREREARRLERERRRAERASAALSGLDERTEAREAPRRAASEPPAPPPEAPPEQRVTPSSADVAAPAGTGGAGADRGAVPRSAHPAPPATRSPRRPLRDRLRHPRPRPRPRPALVVLALFAIAVLVFCNALFQPFHGESGERVVFKVPRGASAGEVADLLAERGVISNGTLFEVRLTLAGRRNDIFAGTYSLAEGMSYSDVISELSKPPSERTIALTVPEGYSREQIAKLATDAGLDGSYERRSRRSKALDPADYGAPGADSLEGFLFPATYELKAGASAEDLVAEQLATFEQQFETVDLDHARSKNLTAYEVLTIASMIDREVMVPAERKLVASVIYNRLSRGEPLAIDATIRYATGNYDRPLKVSELQIDSPYNTRENQGLPPTPIGNPGLAAIRAAAKPAETDYLFYVVKPGTCGEHEFTETLEEHTAAQRRYEDAREAAGGKSPTEC